jgi:hypothetical protein
MHPTWESLRALIARDAEVDIATGELVALELKFLHSLRASFT